MIDQFTFEQCKINKDILQLKINNLEHCVKQAEDLIAESQISNEALIFLRKKVAESNQDLAVLYLLKEKLN